MRHASSMVAAMEGISRPAFRIARELASNSRSGLTVRFLSKKLGLPEEEIEYLVEVNHRFLFVDLTKIKIVAEGVSAVKRVAAGLENRGDVPSLYRHVKSLAPHDFRQLEEQVGLANPGSKKRVVEELLSRHYVHPDSVVTYVATRGFSSTARELFDIVWQSKEGVMPASKISALHGESEYKVEQGLWELFRGLALFEMFRFDAEDRMVRVAGLLSEIRQRREETTERTGHKTRLSSHRIKPDFIETHNVGFSDVICRLVAALAAKPARLRGDGELFREDRRRLHEICPEDSEPSLGTCLWVAEGVGWLARVDNGLRAGELEPLIELDRLGRHRVLSDWLLDASRQVVSRNQIVRMFEELKPGAWYRTMEVVRHAMRAQEEDEQPILKSVGGHWRYISPSTAANAELRLLRLIEEPLLWLGAIDHAEVEGSSFFLVTKLGECLVQDKDPEAVAEMFPQRKTEIVVQPNFEIIVPSQDVDALLTVPLDQFAVRASTGQATVYHLSKESYVRAIQEGYDGDAFFEFLLAHNRGGGLPANVMTTLEDWRGAMKRVRLRTVQVLESDDPLILADLMHRRRFRKYFTPSDPSKMALYSKISKSELTKELEKEGFIVE